MTKKQKRREQMAKLCDRIGGKNNQSSKRLRATNRRVDKQKGKTHA